jgi:ADP-ribose pyrophosphatase YjhB (NUDIX family)
MQEGRFSVIPTVYLLLRSGDAILLARRCHTGFHDGEYSLPAGHLDGEETLLRALARESKEEIGIDLEEENLRLVHIMHRREQDEQRVNFFFVAIQWQGEPAIMEPDKCDDLSWFPVADLPQKVVPYVKQAIDCIGRGVIYSEYGW